MKEGSKAPSSAGFSAKVLNPALAIKGKSRPASYRFQAPGVIYLRSQAEAADAGDKPGDKPRKPEMSFCAQLHTVPLGKGRCRLLLNVSIPVPGAISRATEDPRCFSDEVYIGRSRIRRRSSPGRGH